MIFSEERIIDQITINIQEQTLLIVSVICLHKFLTNPTIFICTLKCYAAFWNFIDLIFLDFILIR